MLLRLFYSPSLGKIVKFDVRCTVQTVNVGYTCLPHAKKKTEEKEYSHTVVATASAYFCWLRRYTPFRIAKFLVHSKVVCAHSLSMGLNDVT